MNGVDGIVAECGGSMMCATRPREIHAPIGLLHHAACRRALKWAERTGPRREGEEDMLDSAASEVLPTSRLSCQIKVTPALEGLVVRLPPVSSAARGSDSLHRKVPRSEDHPLI
jgi:ferredoxin